ncbi:MAG: toll/interleukin-1 receptor domain-containing protein [Verrucomicrobiales bacterium]|nr:toll/interleukin-1 receptor domain-containing protein [Verrucomicrobiales bacterium]
MPRTATATSFGGSPRVYVSYTWRERLGEERALNLADRLREAGVDARIDVHYRRGLHGFTAPPLVRAGDDAWTRWQEEQIRDADRVLIVCGPEYARSPAGSGVARDLHFMHEDLKRPGVELRKFIPVGYAPYARNQRNVPPFLQGANYYNLGRGSKIGNLHDLIRHLCNEFPLERGSGPTQRRSSPAANPSPITTDQAMSNANRDTVFVSYSHRDKKLFQEFKTMLAPVLRQGPLALWDDTKIKPGAKWKEEIKAALDSAKVAVLLVSQNFLASDYIAQNELPPLLKAVQDEGVTVFWICLSSCLHEQTEIADYQAAHDVSKPLDRLSKPDRQAMLSEICAKLVQVFTNP